MATSPSQTKAATTAAARPAVFGVRHLSPGAAWHLRRFLDRVRPTIVLVEGVADGTELIGGLVDRRVRPPVAVLAYTEAMPIRTLVSPLAVYSPEYQALRWAHEHQVETRFIDLPSANFLAIERNRTARLVEQSRRSDADADVGADAGGDADAGPGADLPPVPGRSLYQRIADAAGEPDYETYWERHFEHDRSDDGYRRGGAAAGRRAAVA